MPLSSKILIIFTVLGMTLGYSLYEKRKFDSMMNAEAGPILVTLPNVTFLELLTKKKITKKDITSKNASLTFIHLWATWCAPCEAELPEFINFARSMKQDGAMFYLVAVNDNDKKIEKFLKRFKELPKNIIIGHDETGKILDLFGTKKVPETYLFGKSYEALKKFSGPQPWGQDIFLEQIRRFIK